MKQNKNAKIFLRKRGQIENVDSKKAGVNSD